MLWGRPHERQRVSWPVLSLVALVIDKRFPGPETSWAAVPCATGCVDFGRAFCIIYGIIQLQNLSRICDHVYTVVDYGRVPGIFNLPATDSGDIPLTKHAEKPSFFFLSNDFSRVASIREFVIFWYEYIINTLDKCLSIVYLSLESKLAVDR